MVIEPLSSAVQTQGTKINKPAEKTASQTSDGAVREIAQPEKNTHKIEDAKNIGQNVNGDSKEQQTNEQNNVEQVRKAVERMNKNMSHVEAVFGIHEDTNRVTIKIINTDTKELIKELPPEKTLDMIAKVWEMAGILVDEKR